MLQTRVKKLREILKEKNLDAFLVSNFYNILYLTGFKSLTPDEREGWVLITNNSVYLFTDARYLTNLGSKIKDLKTKLITPEKGLIKHLQEIVIEEHIQQLGFEGDDLKVNELQRIKENLINVEMIPLERLVIKIREIKDEEEIGNLRKSCQIADKCLEAIIKEITVGTTEREISFKIEFWLKKNGYEMAFDPIVAVDKNSAVPHYDTKNGRNEKVKKNSIILIDYGVKADNYHSDTTRMIFTGRPTDQMANTYGVLKSAEEKTIDRLKIDNNPVSIDQYCRQQLTDNNQLPSYPHSTGHGVGLHIHEFPKISFTSTDILLPNQVVTIEPGVYLENKWGMRIEDTVLIKENRQIEVLTRFSKEMIIKS